MKVRWYKKGKFSNPEELPETINSYYLKIVKFNYNDAASYNRCRYWAVDEKEGKILDRLDPLTFIKVSSYSSITDEEFMKVKNDEIVISNNKGTGSDMFMSCLWSNLMEYFPEESFYI